MYGELLCLLEEYLAGHIRVFHDLREQFKQLCTISGTRHDKQKTFVFKDLATSSHVYKHRDSTKAPYEGPFKVIDRNR